MAEKKTKQFPGQQQQEQPGIESKMRPMPKAVDINYRAAGKLEGKTAIITGGDSGIGRAVAVTYAKEGADVAIIYLDEHKDAEETRAMVEKEGRQCLLISGDIGDDNFCQEAVERVAGTFGHIDILVNNAAEQHTAENIEDITGEQLEKTFKTNIFSMFYMTRAAMPYLKQGAAIINTTSVVAYQGHPKLIDYASTKGAILAFTRSLSQNLADKGIRVNAVAPGPIWTPLIPASFDKEHLASFGSHTPMGRAGQPEEVAPSYVFLACDDSSYMTGQVLHPNGGQVVNG